MLSCVHISVSVRTIKKKAIKIYGDTILRYTRTEDSQYVLLLCAVLHFSLDSMLCTGNVTVLSPCWLELVSLICYLLVKGVSVNESLLKEPH